MRIPNLLRRVADRLRAVPTSLRIVADAASAILLAIAADTERIERERAWSAAVSKAQAEAEAKHRSRRWH